jgi:hypothetical protein
MAKSKNEIKLLYDQTMSSQPKIITEAIRRVIEGPEVTPHQIKSKFSHYVQEIEQTAYKVFLEAQQLAAKRAIKKYFEGKSKGLETNKIIQLMADSFTLLDRFFLSLGQSRKARAGSTFEAIIKHLFRKLNYPFDEQQIINGQPDFLLPSREHYDKNPMDCIVFTAKRTIRERWRQIVTEGTRGLGFFLATIDRSISDKQLKEMKAHRIYLVVPKDISTSDIYQNAENVLDFETFFLDHLDPAMKRWKRKVKKIRN